MRQLMSNAQLENQYLRLGITLILIFPIVINSVKILGNLILLIFAVIGIYIAITENKNPFKIKELRLFSWLTFGYFFVMSLSILYANGLDAQFHHLGRKLHFLLAPWIALAILQIDFPLKKILLSIKVGLIVIGIIAVVQFYFQLGDGMRGGMINSNVFSDLAVSMLFLSIVQVFSETPKERLITLLSTLTGVAAILIASSRGAWLSFVILSLVYIVLIYRPFLRHCKRRKIFLVLVLAVFFGFIGSQTDVNKRTSQAVGEVKNWYFGNNTNTSNGLRMQMWSAGLQAAQDSPWFGYGYRNANKVASEYASENKKIIRNKTHLHNEYLTNLVSAGIIGLLSLLILLFTPMVVFYRKLKNKDTYHYSVMGILLCIGYATFGFTHIAFGEEHLNAFYVLFMGFLLPRVMKNN